MESRPRHETNIHSRHLLDSSSLLLGSLSSARAGAPVLRSRIRQTRTGRRPELRLRSTAVRQSDHDAQRCTLRTIIAWAYHLTNAEYQLVAAPTEKHLWDDYDIQALAPGSPNDDDLRLMFQALLEDRFQLKVHREKRELAAYDLVVAKGGSKLVAAPPRSAKLSMGFGGSSSWAEFRRDGKHLVGMGASVEEMVVVLTRQMSAPVRDRTGLAGTYDFDLAFSTGVDGSDKPVLATAIHDLGLNLEKSKGTFAVLVIDHLQKSSVN